MVKVLFLGLLAATMCGFACAAPAPQPDLPSRREEMPPTASPPQSQPPLEDPAARSERSTNLSHVTGTARKIQMFIKNRHLQLLPDGTVNGTTDDTSPFTILQRTTIGVGQMKIQGVATCQYLCMDSCGLLYGSREFGDECIFNETIEQHHYNTYSSTKYSNERRTLYLALNRRGQPRKVLLRAHQQLGRLSSYTRVLTRTVAPERTEEFHPMRHHAHMCSSTSDSNSRLAAPTVDHPLDQPRCRKRKKRKKKKRKCSPDVDPDSELCQKRQQNTTNHRKLQPNRLNTVKKCEFEDSEECQRDVTINKKKLLKAQTSDKALVNGAKKPKKPKKSGKKRQQVITTTEAAVISVPEEVGPDEDYGLDSTTHWDWDDSTAVPDMSMSISMSMPTSAQPD